MYITATRSGGTFAYELSKINLPYNLGVIYTLYLQLLLVVH